MSVRVLKERNCLAYNVSVYFTFCMEMLRTDQSRPCIKNLHLQCMATSLQLPLLLFLVG